MTDSLNEIEGLESVEEFEIADRRKALNELFLRTRIVPSYQQPAPTAATNRTEMAEISRQAVGSYSSRPCITL